MLMTSNGKSNQELCSATTWRDDIGGSGNYIGEKQTVAKIVQKCGNFASGETEPNCCPLYQICMKAKKSRIGDIDGSGNRITLDQTNGCNFFANNSKKST